MKDLLTALAATFIFFSCTILEPGIPLGEPRVRRSYPGGTAQNQPDDLPPLEDTVYLVSAINFPESYDWQRDSAFGAVSCTLILFRNEKAVLEVPAGPGAAVGVSPDMHHLIGSSLFTEYSHSGGTVIKRNGETLAQWPEREKLQGLIYKDGVLHTLGLEKDGAALCYRRNGEVIIKAGGGIPMGGFGADTYGPEGALYEDSGHICFAFKTVQDKQQSVFIICDGKTETQASIPDANVLDAKMIDGKSLILYNQKPGVSVLMKGKDRYNMVNAWGKHWQSGAVLYFNGRLAVAGTFIDHKDQLREGIGWESNRVLLPDGTSYIYCDGERYAGIEQPPREHPDCYFFHRNCALLLDGELVKVLTPRSSNEQPFMEHGSKRIMYNLHGYLSGVAVELPEQ